MTIKWPGEKTFEYVLNRKALEKDNLVIPLVPNKTKKEHKDNDKEH